MTENSTDVLPAGTRLAHYEVREVLGAGGMGRVYLAHDTALDRPVALKVLRPEVAGDPELVDRFVREARAAARVNHPNLAHVYFVGTDGGRPFFAMEYCPGRTLEQAVKAEGPVSLVRGLDVMVQAARGLAAAHGAGVIHRDVKPSNLMALPDGTVKVTDFGLAKSLNADVQMTGGRILGTPTYMSPEQVRGKPVDARTDVYLLGLTAYFLFTGRPPFASDQVGEVINDQMNTPLPGVTAARADLPPALDAALARLCAKDPAARPATMIEVAAMLEDLRPRSFTAAPLLARLIATALDLILCLMGWGGLAFSVWGLSQSVGMEVTETIDHGGGNYTIRLREVVDHGLLLFSVLSLTLGWEWQWLTTPGKTAFHLAVVREDGAPPGQVALLGRFLLKYPGVLVVFVPWGWTAAVLAIGGVQALACGAGVLVYFFADGRTLTDVVTRTRVVVRAPLPWTVSSLTRGRRSA